MNLNQRQKLLAVLAIAVVGLFMADKLFITPLFNSFKARSESVAKLKEQVREGEAMLKRDTALTDQWDRVKKNALSAKKPEAESQMLKAFDKIGRASCRERVYSSV